jgi:hypothetical protein
MTSTPTAAPGATALATDIADTAVRLPERALLVALNIREWRARRHDREITARVAREHGAERAAGCYTKALVPKTFLARIAQVRVEARAVHHQLTLPWCDEGFRILPVDLHLGYMERFRDLRARFHDAVSGFLAAYDDAKAAARVSLGSLYREADYPSSSRLEDAFAFEVKPQPLPTGHDWRIDLPEATVASIRQELEARLEDARRLALADLYRRLANVVSRMATTLAEPGRVFRDTLVGNVRQLCDLLPALNIAADPDLDSLARDIDVRLASLDPALLRHDPDCRQAAAVDATALLDTISARLASYTGVAA